jgi:hypothetical protein
MNNKLKFHIDSARAYSHFNNKDKKESINNNLKVETNVLGIYLVIFRLNGRKKNLN